MATLTLIRHGQASFLTDNYDRLSPLGEEQARLLARSWMGYEKTFTHVYSGPLERQKRTAQIVGEAFRDSGLPWPEIEILPEFEEYHAEAFLKTYLPVLIHQDPDIRRQHEAFKQTHDLHVKGRAYQKMFEAAVRRWIRGEVQTEGIETLDHFRDRVHRALDSLRAHRDRGRRIAAFTSGGPIGVAVAYATGGNLEKTLELTWMVRNTSITEFLFSEDRFTLSVFNSIPHLDDPRLWTYR